MNKKIITIVLSLMLGVSLGAVLPVTVAHAANSRDPETLRVYYSESIGAGEQVYTLTSCEKAPAYAPLTCSKELVAEFPQYEALCQTGDGKKTEEGKNLKGCLKQTIGGKEEIAKKLKFKLPGMDEPYELPYYNIEPPQDKKCTEDGGNQEFIFGRKYAVLEFPKTLNLQKEADFSKYIIGNISWPTTIKDGIGGDDKLSDHAVEYVKRTFKPGDDMDVSLIPAYEVVQCTTVDALIDEDGGHGAYERVDASEAAVQNIEKQNSNFDALIKAGCNNDNTTAGLPGSDESNIGGVKRATSLDNNPVLSCTISERINGKSGTDLIARYVGAIYRWAAGVIGIISVLIIVASGIQMTIAGGDQGGVDKAKERITQSLMGLVLLFLSALILYTINPTFFTG